MRDGHDAAYTSHKTSADAELLAINTSMFPSDGRHITRSTETSAQVSIQPTITNILSLSKDKFHNTMRRRYGLALIDLTKHCDGCSAKFTINHALACKKHNEVETEKGGIAIQALESNRARNKPRIITCYDTPFTQMRQSG